MCVHRSGTTLLRLMLNNHPHLAVPFETVFIIEFYRKLERYGDLSVRANRERLLTDITACERKTKGDLVQDPEALLAVDGVGPIVAQKVADFFGESRNQEEIGRLRGLGLEWPIIAPRSELEANGPLSDKKTTVFHNTFGCVVADHESKLWPLGGFPPALSR